MFYHKKFFDYIVVNVSGWQKLRNYLIVLFSLFCLSNDSY